MKTLLVCLLAAGVAGAGTLEERINAALGSSPVSARVFWGIRMVDPATGTVLYQRNAENFFAPASNTKLFSTSLALMRLGPRHRFRTLITAERAPDASGRLACDLVLAGGGDPTLSARAVPYKKGPITGNPLAALEEMADQVIERGVRRIEGDVAGDDSAWPWEPPPEGWAEEDTNWEYGAPVSALAVNDNAFTLALRGGRRPGDPAVVTLRPPLEFFAIDNRVRTSAAEENKIHIERGPGSRQLRLWGTLRPNASAEPQRLACPDPALYAACALWDALTRRGVAITGRPVARHRWLNQGTPSEAGPNQAVVLARRESPPLVEILRIIDKVSQNLHAEMVLREVARVRRGDGSREAALQELGEFLEQAGIAKSEYHFEDGSGLSRLTLVTPAAVTELLLYMYRSEHREAWASLMPVGGEDGTLSSRFSDNPDGRRVKAKTGTLSGVSALSGYLETRDGRTLVFSVLTNNYHAPSSEVRSVIDRICLAAIE